MTPKSLNQFFGCHESSLAEFSFITEAKAIS
jgi:hypothetical protein